MDATAREILKEIRDRVVDRTGGEEISKNTFWKEMKWFRFTKQFSRKLLTAMHAEGLVVYKKTSFCFVGHTPSLANNKKIEHITNQNGKRHT